MKREQLTCIDFWDREERIGQTSGKSNRHCLSNLVAREQTRFSVFQWFVYTTCWIFKGLCKGIIFSAAYMVPYGLLLACLVPA